MKTSRILCYAVAFFMVVTACNPKDTFTVEGEIAGIPDGTVLTLVPGATHKSAKPVAQSIVSNGKFSFEGTVESPRLFYIGQKGIVGLLPLMVENGTSVQVSAKAEYGGEKSLKWVDFEEVQVSNSPIHDELLKKMSYQKELEQLSVKNAERHKAIAAQLSEAYLSKNKRMIDSLERTDAYAVKRRDDSVYSQLRNEKVKELILKNKNTWWAPFLLLYKFVYFEDEQKEWFAAFSAEAKQSYYGKLAESILFPAASVGNPAPAFTLKNADGNSVTLEQLLTGKKYLLIDFWASWCGPCRREIPNLKAVYEEFAPRGLEIVSISIDRKVDDWQKALKEEQLSWPNFRDDSGISDAYSVRAIPAIFLVDAKGTIIATKLRGEALHTKLAELLP